MPRESSQFKKGQSGNPAGRTPLPGEVQLLRRMTHAEIAEVGTLIIEGDIEALRQIVIESQAEIDRKVNPHYQPRKHTVLKVWMATCAVKAIQKGDVYTLNELLNRIVGKVKTEIELRPASGSQEIPLAHMSDDDVERKFLEYQEKARE